MKCPDPRAIRTTWWRRRNAADRDAILKARFSAYDSSKQQDYLAATHHALGGAPLNADQEANITIGLALLPKDHRLHASYSLARVQLAMWFLFAVAAGVFLWAVYGQLPAIDGSLLALLGLTRRPRGSSYGEEGLPQKPTLLRNPAGGGHNKPAKPG